MDGRTDGRTKPLLELCVRNKKGRRLGTEGKQILRREMKKKLLGGGTKILRRLCGGIEGKAQRTTRLGRDNDMKGKD